MAAALQGDIFFGSEISKKIEPSNPEFVTVVTVDPVETKGKQPFVTILSIGSESNDWSGDDSEEVLVYRLPGERLGFGLKFDGGSNANEKVARLMIQSCAPDSPASRTLVSWGHFSPGDEILEIDNVSVTEMTRMECVRSLKESNVQLKLRVRKGDINNIRATAAKPTKNVPPPVPPRKYPRRTSKHANSVVCPPDGFGDKEKIEREKLNIPEPQVYTDLIAQETVSLGNHESESDDTGSSMSTVVDKQFSTPTTSNSSFSDIRSITSAEITEPPSPDDFSQRKFDLDKVLEPFLQLEREFSSSATIEDNNDLFQKLVAAATLKENDGVLEPPDKFQDQCYQANESVQSQTTNIEQEEPPKPLPRKEIPKPITKYGKKRPPPPPPPPQAKESNRCPTPNREEHHESSDSDISVDHLPRLIDFVPKDRVDLVIPSAVHPNPVDMLLERQRILSIVNQEAAEQECSRSVECHLSSKIEEKGLQKVDDGQLEEISQRVNIGHHQQKNSEDAERSRVSAHECLDSSHVSSNESDTLRVEPALSFSSSEASANQHCATIGSKKEEASKMEPLLAYTSSVTLNIPSSPPAYSRMPPDGHEFPQNYQELRPSANPYELPSPAIPSSEPAPHTETFYSSKKTAAYIDVINEAKLLDVERKGNDGPEMKSRELPKVAVVGKIRTRESWRNDEKSERSVKDKIAMFSSAIVNSSSGPGGRAETTVGAGISHSRAYSKSILAMNTVGCRVDRGKSKETYGTGCERGRAECGGSNPISIMNRTQSSIDLTLSSSSCSSAYSSCSPDSSLSPMSSPSYTIGSSSTLPRKHRSHVGTGATAPYVDKKHTLLTRTTSFTGATTLHSRSQSLVDVLHTPHRYGNCEDARKDSLTTLIEQRRRTMSKLRGLVIPEKACESQNPIIDLPEIKSKEVDRYSCASLQRTAKNARQEHHATYDSSWKSVLNTTDMPKYSPAFKRKTLTVYGVSSSASSLSSSLNSSREELRSDVKTNRSPPAKPPRNSINYNNSQLLYGPPAYKPLFANDKCADKKEPSRNDSYISRNEPACKLQEDSDNDSAVSSSRSSLCQEYSPPSSPSPNTEYDTQTNDRVSNDSPSQSSSRTLRRTLSSETNVSVTSTISTLTSGSQASCSSNSDSSKDGKSKRILKAESVEAINRKNVLSSAKYSCGQDFKVGSPLIKDVFEGHPNPKFQDRYSECEKQRNWYDYDKLNGDETIKVAYLEIQDSEESDFSTKENSSSADTDDNVDKSLELMDSMSDTYTPEYAINKKDLKDSLAECNTTTFTKLEKQVYSQVMKNEDLRKAGNELENKISSRSMVDGKSTIHVSDIKKTFEKIDGSGKVSAIKSTQNHLRMSSMDSTTSEDSLPATTMSASNLLKEQQFGSITSLASSTSLISQQELQQLIDEANQTLEETAGSGGHDLMVIILHRETVTSSIGITLAGGADYETKEITVHKVLVGSPADKDGRIQKGDRILSINGRNMKGVTHREALSILKAPRSEVVLVVSRWRTDGASDNAAPVQAEDALAATFRNTIRPPRIPEVNSDCDTDNFTRSTANSNYSKTVKGPVISVTLIKEGGGLGFSLEGGKDSPFGDLPLTIKKIFTGGCAAKSGLLFAGDELLSLNGVDVTSMSRTEAWNMMKRLSDGQVVVNVRRTNE